jgi:hypothetical protein
MTKVATEYGLGCGYGVYGYGVRAISKDCVDGVGVMANIWLWSRYQGYEYGSWKRRAIGYMSGLRILCSTAHGIIWIEGKCQD